MAGSDQGECKGELDTDIPMPRWAFSVPAIMSRAMVGGRLWKFV